LSPCSWQAVRLRINKLILRSPFDPEHHGRGVVNHYHRDEPSITTESNDPEFIYPELIEGSRAIPFF
jgi:hypothetical protein